MLGGYWKTARGRGGIYGMAPERERFMDELKHALAECECSEETR